MFCFAVRPGEVKVKQKLCLVMSRCVVAASPQKPDDGQYGGRGGEKEGKRKGKREERGRIGVGREQKERRERRSKEAKKRRG